MTLPQGNNEHAKRFALLNNWLPQVVRGLKIWRSEDSSRQRKQMISDITNVLRYFQSLLTVKLGGS